MSTGDVCSMTVEEYDRAADEYQDNLPLEHVMEASVQATQREITLASLALLRRRRPEVHVYNELLVQYFYKGSLRQVVPDNMVALNDRPLVTKKSYIVEYEPPPFLMLEYVTSRTEDKDYNLSFQKYEQELKVPFALFFHPENQDLQVYRHTGSSYQPIVVNAAGRYLIPPLDLEVAIQEGWVRFWHKGELLRLPAALEEAIDELQARLEQSDRLAREQQQRAEQADRLAREQQQRAEQADRLAREQQQRAEQADRLAREQQQRAEQAELTRLQEKQQFEAELNRLRALLAAQAGGSPPAANG